MRAMSSSSSQSQAHHRYPYQMVSQKLKDPSAASEGDSHETPVDQNDGALTGSWKQQAFVDLKPSWKRNKYTGALLFNACSFILPALYSTLSKLWVANIDASMVVTTDSYTYIGVVAEVLNEGLPRASWLVIGDNSSRSPRSRLQISHTLILFQSILGLVMSIAFVAGASNFASGFVPVEVRSASVTYVRISSFSAFSSAVEYAVNTSTRALDRPDVPLVISTTKFAINIILDLITISKFHVGGINPTVNMQAGVQLACNLASAFAGLAYFVYRTSFNSKSEYHRDESGTSLRPSWPALIILARPGAIFFVESAIRNALYLWLVHNIVTMGSDYATAWGVFSTIRWGLIMVPVLALETTTLTFIGHSWGRFRRSLNVEIIRTPGNWKQLLNFQDMGTAKPQATWKQLWSIARWSFYSLLIALIIEIPMCLLMSFLGARPFARYLSGSDTVARITEKMWQAIDWCYIFYAMSTQLAAILLSTRPLWYLYQSLASNLLYVLPWAIVCQTAAPDAEHAWTYHSLVFGGSLVFSFFDVVLVDGLWAWTLKKGKGRLNHIRAA